jgi:ribosome recycling factor
MIEISEDEAVPLSQIAQVTVRDGSSLVVTLFDEKGAKAVEKSLRESDLGVTPIIEGNTIKVMTPK